jgi:hypothetical protein
MHAYRLCRAGGIGGIVSPATLAKVEDILRALLGLFY